VSRKSRIGVTILTGVLVALSICAVPAAMAKSSSSSQALRFKVVKRTSHYDIVKGHSHRFAVKRGARKVTVRGVGRCRLVRRTPHVVFLRAFTGHAKARPTITSPNSGALVKDSPTKITWRMSSAVSTGYFQISLKNTVGGASTALTSSSIPANRGTTSYSVPWNVAQAVGTYRLWVHYYASGGRSQASDSSDGTVSITLATVPTPTPTPTPTATPTPTPTPTATPTPDPAPMTVSGPLNLNNAHDLVYDSVDFEGKGSGYGDASGLIYIQGASYNITFKNCIIGTNQDGVGNGVKLVDAGAGMHDITFDHCTFKYQPRMGFECIGREVGSATGYRRINVTNCTFDAGAGEAISYDDENGTAGSCTVSGNVVAGAGVGTSYAYAKVFEINGTHNMTVTDNYFGAGRDGILNFQMRDTNPTGWVFSNNIVDATHIAAGITVDYGIAQPLCANKVYGGTFANNVITNLSSWNISYIADCHNMDWRATTWLGPNNVPYQTGSSGNLY